MKIAITSTGTSMDSPVDPRFGRSAYIAFVDLETGQLEALENPFVDVGVGAGTQAAQFVLDKGAEALLTGHCGPKACAVLGDAHVQVVDGVSGTLREATERFRQQEGARAGSIVSRAVTGLGPTGRGRAGGFGRGLGRGAGRGGRGGQGPGRGGRGGRGSGGGGAVVPTDPLETGVLSR